MERSDQRKDLGLLALAWLMLKHGGKPEAMANEAPRFGIVHHGIEPVCKAAVAAGSLSTPGWASELGAYQAIAAAWTAENEHDTVLAHLKYRRVAFEQATIVETTAPVSAWVGAGKPIPVARMNLAITARLPMRKRGCVVGFTDELFSSWGPGTVDNMREVIKRENNYGLDRALLDPDLAPSDDGPGSLLYGLTPIPSTGGTAAQVEADFKALFAAHRGGDLKRSLGVTDPTTALFLSTLRDANGFRVFPEMTAVGGAIWGVPFVTTTAANMVGSPTINVVALFDGSKILVADDGFIDLAPSGEASVQMSDAPAIGPTTQVSAFQTNMKLLKILRVVNFARAADDAATYLMVAY